MINPMPGRLCHRFARFKQFKQLQSFSTAANEQKVSVNEVPTVTISKGPEPTEKPQIFDGPLVRKLREHALFQKFQNKTIQTASNLNRFARGPIRSNLLVSFEILKLIVAEQRLVPALSTWPQAKDAYVATFYRLRSFLASLNSDKLMGMVKEMTWGDLGRALRVTAEMASFYYIGELVGMILSLPFK